MPLDAVVVAGPIQARGQSVAAASANRVTGSANAAATVSYAAGGAGVSHRVGGFGWSYSGAPTGGKLTITDGSTVVEEFDITAGGPGEWLYPEPEKYTANTALTCTLAAGGSGIVGKLKVIGKRTE